MLKFFIKTVYLFITILTIHHPLFSQNIKVHSIIKLEDSIPEECGIKLLFEKKGMEMSVKIKKINNETYTYFEAISLEKKIEKVDILAENLSVVELISNKPQIQKNRILFKINTSRNEIAKNQTAAFFQKFIVSGGKILIDSESFEISGPINSKVRLEYLFCTGEMFHPKYDK